MSVLSLESLAKAAAAPNSLLTKSGLVMAPIRDGSGSPVTASDSVRATVRQRLFDGTIVGDEELENEPIVVSLSRAFQCWKEGMSMMKVGGRSRLACPPSLTYGERDGPFGTKPGSVLVFDIEILEVLRVEESSTPIRTP